MKYLLYVVVLALAFFAPVDRLDVANLQPVEAVAIYMENGAVVLETDTQDRGRGDSVSEALRDLKENTPTVVYLDTAEYLLVAENAASYVQELREYLKPSVRVGQYTGGDVKEEALYLEVHGEPPKLRDWKPPES